MRENFHFHYLPKLYIGFNVGYKDVLLELHTVKPRPEAHMDMILFEVFLKSIDLIPQQYM